MEKYSLLQVIFQDGLELLSHMWAEYMKTLMITFSRFTSKEMRRILINLNLWQSVMI